MSNLDQDKNDQVSRCYSRRLEEVFTDDYPEGMTQKDKEKDVKLDLSGRNVSGEKNKPQQKDRSPDIGGDRESTQN